MTKLSLFKSITLSMFHKKANIFTFFANFIYNNLRKAVQLERLISSFRLNKKQIDMYVKSWHIFSSFLIKFKQTYLQDGRSGEFESLK